MSPEHGVDDRGTERPSNGDAAGEPKHAHEPPSQVSSGGPPAGRARDWKNWAMPLALMLVMLGSSYLFGGSGSNDGMDYSTFYAALQKGEVESVVLQGDEVVGELSAPQVVDGRTTKKFRTQLPARDDPALLPLLRDKGVKMRIEPGEAFSLSAVLMGLLPWVLIFGAWYWMSHRMRAAGGAGQNPLAGILGKRGKSFEREDDVGIRFDDVAGLDEAKRDLQEVIDVLREPERFAKLGGKMPRGVLLAGAPGTGKTLLARAVAGEAGVPFFSISGSEFIELFVGVGAARVRELFETAKKAEHAIIFIDEIDAVGRSRGAGLGGGNDEREQTLNQLLAAMDGFDRSDRVVVLAATNRPDVLDSALLRPGRFDRRIVVDLPASGAREAILKVHVRGKPLAADVDLAVIAAATPGFSGADLANLANEAALRALRRVSEDISAADFELSRDKILLGAPREAHLSPSEKRRIAVHEAGHALLAHTLDRSSPLRRVSILPRGASLGATQQLPPADTSLQTKSQLLARLAVLLGGYSAEELVLGEVSTGAENDLRQASNIAQRMVGQLGMGEGLGPVFHEHRTEHPFLGARIATDSGVSDATVYAIEREAQRLLIDAKTTATATLTSHRGGLDALTNALLERETLEQEELFALFADASAPPRIERTSAAN